MPAPPVFVVVSAAAALGLQASLDNVRHFFEALFDFLGPAASVSSRSSSQAARKPRSMFVATVSSLARSMGLPGRSSRTAAAAARKRLIAAGARLATDEELERADRGDKLAVSSRNVDRHLDCPPPLFDSTRLAELS